jgi:Tfp pilus assembly protein PilF
MAGNDWINTTIDLTINTDFDSALYIVNKQIEKDHNDYRAYFYLAATLNSKMTHFENQDEFDQFNMAIDKTIQLIEEQLDNNAGLSDPIYAQLLFYKGSAYGYRAYYQGATGNWLGAISNGIKSVGDLKESLESDSTVYGAYLGIGVYKYWRYSRLKFISWLPFIPDDRDEGIKMITTAISHDSLSRYMAMHQLVYILLDYGHTERAIYFAEKIVDKYPQSQFMWWAKAHAYFKYKDLHKATSAYLNLHRLIEADEQRNIAHLLKCNLKLALIYRDLKEFPKCMDCCQKILMLSATTILTDSVRDIVSQTREIVKECQSEML